MGEAMKTRRGESKGKYATFIYILGDECVALTGGWSIADSAYSTTIKNADSIESTRGWVSTSIGYGEVYLSQLIDFTDYTKLVIDAEVTGVYDSGTYYGIHFGIGATVRNMSSAKKSVLTVSARQEFTLDISSVTGNQYAMMVFQGSLGKIHKLRME